MLQKSFMSVKISYKEYNSKKNTNLLDKNASEP